MAVPVRLGYGATGGPDLENSGPCGDRRFTPMFNRAASEIAQVIEAMARRPDVDPANVVALGQSVGGGAGGGRAGRRARRHQFRGRFGRGSGQIAWQPCGPERLQETYAGYAATTRMPMLWIYTENDLYWGRNGRNAGPRLHNAAGGHAQFERLGPDGDNGHSLFTHAPEKWKPLVRDFLRAQGYAMPEPGAASGQARRP